MTAFEIGSRVTEVRVSLLPADHPDFDQWTVRVVWRGGDLYAVIHRGALLTDAGQWEREPRPGEGEDDFHARTRFGYLAACSLAHEQAPLIRNAGMTAVDRLATP